MPEILSKNIALVKCITVVMRDARMQRREQRSITVNAPLLLHVEWTFLQFIPSSEYRFTPVESIDQLKDECKMHLKFQIGREKKTSTEFKDL